MSLSKSILAYNDCETFFQAAENDPKSIRIRCSTEAEAVHLRFRMSYFRKLDRERNCEVYQPGEFMHGRSEYDKYVLKVRLIDDEWWLCLTRAEADNRRVVSMAEDDLIQIEQSQPKLQIEGPKLQIEHKPEPIKRRL